MTYVHNGTGAGQSRQLPSISQTKKKGTTLAPNTEIRQCKRDDEGVGFGAELPFIAHKENDESISSYRQERQNPTKNPKP